MIIEIPLLVIPNPGTALKNSFSLGFFNKSGIDVALKHRRVVIMDIIKSSPDVNLYLSHT
jgi:hypothetical protein